MAWPLAVWASVGDLAASVTSTQVAFTPGHLNVQLLVQIATVALVRIAM